VNIPGVKPNLGLVVKFNGIWSIVTGATLVTGTTYDITVFPSPVFADAGVSVDFHKVSSVGTGSHIMEFVGSGVTYNALQQYGGVPIPGNETREIAPGRCYFFTSDHLGNMKVGKSFKVEQATGTVTISTDQFNLSGLNNIGPFKRNGVSVGVALEEVSNDPELRSSTGQPDGTTVPTTFAVKQYVDKKTIPAGGNQFQILRKASSNDYVTEWTTLTKYSVGLGNVLDVQQIPVSLLGVANGVATLDSSGTLPNVQVPITVSSRLVPPGGSSAQVLLKTSGTNYDTAWATINKSTLGLGNVLDVQQIPDSLLGVANGVATLDASGVVRSNQIPVAITTGTITANAIASNGNVTAGNLFTSGTITTNAISASNNLNITIGGTLVLAGGNIQLGNSSTGRTIVFPAASANHWLIQKSDGNGGNHGIMSYGMQGLAFWKTWNSNPQLKPVFDFECSGVSRLMRIRAESASPPYGSISVGPSDSTAVFDITQVNHPSTMADIRCVRGNIVLEGASTAGNSGLRYTNPTYSGPLVEKRTDGIQRWGIGVNSTNTKVYAGGTTGRIDLGFALSDSTFADGMTVIRNGITTTANVGINTTAPTSTLDVVGNARVSGALRANTLTANSMCLSANAAPINDYGQMTFSLLNNTTLQVRVRGSDGIMRAGNVTLQTSNDAELSAFRSINGLALLLDSEQYRTSTSSTWLDQSGNFQNFGSTSYTTVNNQPRVLTSVFPSGEFPVSNQATFIIFASPGSDTTLQRILTTNNASSTYIAYLNSTTSTFSRYASGVVTTPTPSVAYTDVYPTDTYTKPYMTAIAVSATSAISGGKNWQLFLAPSNTGIVAEYASSTTNAANYSFNRIGWPTAANSWAFAVFAVYNRVLSQMEIQAIYDSQKLRFGLLDADPRLAAFKSTSGLLLLLDSDQYTTSTSTTWLDQSGNDNNFTATATTMVAGQPRVTTSVFANGDFPVPVGSATFIFFASPSSDTTRQRVVATNAARNNWIAYLETNNRYGRNQGGTLSASLNPTYQTVYPTDTYTKPYMTAITTSSSGRGWRLFLIDGTGNVIEPWYFSGGDTTNYSFNRIGSMVPESSWAFALFAVYNRALAIAELQTIYNSQKTRFGI
jgi:hypothetical protein